MLTLEIAPNKYMSRYSSKAEMLLQVIANVQFATKFNVSAFTQKTASTVEGSMKEPRRLFKQLLDADLITPISVYGFGKQHSCNTFYRVTRKGHKIVENQKYRYIEPKSMNNIYHESGLIDLMLGFIYGFWDHKVEIDYNKVINGYKPDAYIRITSKDICTKTYEYLVEFERTRSNQAILDEKLRKNEKLGDLRNYGLSSRAKILYVLTDEFYNVYWRPVEYETNQEVKPLIDKVNYRLKKLIEASKQLNSNKYLFTALHNFTRLNEAVWRDPSGQPRKLIN